MIKIKLFKQTPGYCGPACVKMVLNYYKVEKTEDELAEIIGATREDGCDPWQITDGIKTIGLNSYYKENSDLEEVKKLLEKNIPVIIDWHPGFGHYSIIVGLDEENVYIADPKKDKIFNLTQKEFNEKWFEFYDDKKVLKEIIVIENPNSSA